MDYENLPIDAGDGEPYSFCDPLLCSAGSVFPDAVFYSAQYPSRCRRCALDSGITVINGGGQCKNVLTDKIIFLYNLLRDMGGR